MQLLLNNSPVSARDETRLATCQSKIVPSIRHTMRRCVHASMNENKGAVQFIQQKLHDERSQRWCWRVDAALWFKFGTGGPAFAGPRQATALVLDLSFVWISSSHVSLTKFQLRTSEVFIRTVRVMYTCYWILKVPICAIRTIPPLTVNN